ncbi:class II fructose-bisphosphate aldolase [Buchnera aphidicola (Mindarus keteleerifoliae)]|uniref:class II fructose-bisphosphate aldolase n=1 Tax=Buchnera aphidicola TaxID=9 RepID=UPI0031B73539
MKKKLNFKKTGVLSGNEAKKLFLFAKKNNFAIPAINCTGIDSINTILNSAEKINSPVIIQLSYGGSEFIADIKSKKIKKEKKAVLGAISAAKHIHLISSYYNIPIILHTDHCPKSRLFWIDELLDEGKKYIKNHGHPLFTSHMIDLSKEKIKENIDTCCKYLKHMHDLNMLLEIELGCTGGEEDGIDNSLINKKLLYTQPIDVLYAYEKLYATSKNFTIAASFGNVHGVYQPGNVFLKPKILKKSQEIIKKKYGLSFNPLNFVFHGGSGSSEKEIKEAIKYGVVKVNIDTDIQWANWKGILNFYKKNKEYLQSQLGNPEGKNIPNKKYYDPRVWIECGKISMNAYLKKIFKKLNAFNVL